MPYSPFCIRLANPAAVRAVLDCGGSAPLSLRQLCILHDSCWTSGEKKRQSQSGAKPPQSKENGQRIPGGGVDHAMCGKKK
jgi:hypothetical protein